MITFNLKKKWYEKIQSGEKTVEYREVKPYWTARIRHEIARSIDKKDLQSNRVYYIPCQTCVLRLGYTKQYMTATITKIEIVDGKNTDLAIDKPVYAIYLDNVKEEIER